MIKKCETVDLVVCMGMQQMHGLDEWWLVEADMDRINGDRPRLSYIKCREADPVQMVFG